RAGRAHAAEPARSAAIPGESDAAALRSRLRSCRLFPRRFRAGRRSGSTEPGCRGTNGYAIKAGDMFTGIIEHAGTIEALERTGDGGRLRVRAPETAARLKLGSSIAVNGCCLTVVELAADAFSADLSGETLRRTSFGEMKPGRSVNLESPLAAGAELGGHFVQGHVDGVGRVARLVSEGPLEN